MTEFVTRVSAGRFGYRLTATWRGGWSVDISWSGESRNPFDVINVWDDARDRIGGTIGNALSNDEWTTVRQATMWSDLPMRTRGKIRGALVAELDEWLSDLTRDDLANYWESTH